LLADELVIAYSGPFLHRMQQLFLHRIQLIVHPVQYTSTKVKFQKT
jgi:hypothetical protein